MAKIIEHPEEPVVTLLRTHGLTIATAESCTGGLVAATLINISGVSEVLKESYITYSDETKEKILHVSQTTLDTYTAVSEQTAREMVQGVTRIAESDVGISVTGIAGPEGGSKDFPVGLVYIGLKVSDTVRVLRFQFSGDRMAVRTQAVTKALEELLALLKEEGYQ